MATDELPDPICSYCGRPESRNRPTRDGDCLRYRSSNSRDITDCLQYQINELRDPYLSTRIQSLKAHTADCPLLAMLEALDIDPNQPSDKIIQRCEEVKADATRYREYCDGGMEMLPAKELEQLKTYANLGRLVHVEVAGLLTEP